MSVIKSGSIVIVLAVLFSISAVLTNCEEKSVWDSVSSSKVKLESSDTLALFCMNIQKETGVRFLLHKSVVVDPRTYSVVFEGKKVRQTNVKSMLEDFAKGCGVKLQEYKNVIAGGPEDSLAEMVKGNETWSAPDSVSISNAGVLAAFLSEKVEKEAVAEFKNMGGIIRAIHQKVGKDDDLRKKFPKGVVMAIGLDETAIPEELRKCKYNTYCNLLLGCCKSGDLCWTIRGTLLVIEKKQPKDGLAKFAQPADALRVALERRTVLVIKFKEVNQGFGSIPIDEYSDSDIQDMLLRSSSESFSILKELKAVVTSVEYGEGEEEVFFKTGSLKGKEIELKEQTEKLSEFFKIKEGSGEWLIFYIPAIDKVVSKLNDHQGPSKVLAAAKSAKKQIEKLVE